MKSQQLPTPAHRGSTFGIEFPLTKFTSYPCAQGEHCQNATKDAATLFLPLRTGGARAPRQSLPVSILPTPAHRGSTDKPLVRTHASFSYPCAQGEHRSTRSLGAGSSFLPLRTGGAPKQGSIGIYCALPTPAHRGSTQDAREG